MSQITHLNTFAANHDTAIAWINQQLNANGLVARPSFDFQVAKSAHTGCTCPHHGTVECDCQILVLLVYSNDGESDLNEIEEPVSLVVHSQDGVTNLSMIGVPSIREGDSLAGKIWRTLGHQNIVNH